MLARFFSRILPVLFIVLLINTAHAQSEQDIAKTLVPHKALYEVELLRKDSGAQIVNIDGKMYYEWHRSCDAWHSNHRFDLLYEYTDSPSMHITSDLSTHEGFNGLTLNYTSRRMRDGDLFEEVRGRAVRDEEGGKAVFTLPEKKTMNMPPDTFFPMGHTLHIIEAINQGKKINNAIIFDGSDAEGARLVNSFIGKQVDLDKSVAKNPHVDQSLLSDKPYYLRLAFFPLTDPDESAEYEMDINLHKNGIISAMNIDYKDFSVSQKLIALEMVKDTCEGEGKE